MCAEGLGGETWKNEVTQPVNLDTRTIQTEQYLNNAKEKCKEMQIEEEQRRCREREREREWEEHAGRTEARENYFETTPQMMKLAVTQLLLVM